MFPLSTIYQLDFGIDPTKWYFFIISFYDLVFGNYI